MAFFGFFCLGKILVPLGETCNHTNHLSMAEVNNTTHPSLIQIRWQQSKTDKFGKVLLSILLARIQISIYAPLLRLSHSWLLEAIVQDHSFSTTIKKHLGNNRFVHEIRVALPVAGITASDYSGHSFRISAATTVAQCGLPETTIQTLGQWTSEAYRT